MVDLLFVLLKGRFLFHINTSLQQYYLMRERQAWNILSFVSVLVHITGQMAFIRLHFLWVNSLLPWAISTDCVLYNSINQYVVLNQQCSLPFLWSLQCGFSCFRCWQIKHWLFLCNLAIQLVSLNAVGSNVAKITQEDF